MTTTQEAMNKIKSALTHINAHESDLGWTDDSLAARAALNEAIAALQASAEAQPSQEPETGEFISVTERLPQRGQRIQGLSRSGAWIETFDPSEPLGHMTHWRAVDDDATDSSEQPENSTQCKHFYSGAPGIGYTCVLCGQPKDSATVEIELDPQPSAPVAQDIQAVMFEVYEYARISDGIDAATFEQRDNQKRKMMAQANKIRAMLSAAPSSQKEGEQKNG